MKEAINIELSPLHLPMKMGFKQASSFRNTGESIWVTTTRGGVAGVGEGCPRPYVTGETVDSCLSWLHPQLANLQSKCVDLNSLRQFVTAHTADIDQNPSAWCAVETALLDLYAREQQMSVEKMLGLDDPFMTFRYTAILGDSEEAVFSTLIKRYLQWGFSDFKIKLIGDLSKDQLKLDTLTQTCNQMGLKKKRIRLDANNLWAGNTQAAIEYLANLKGNIYGIEEPVEPKNPDALYQISTSLRLPVILDENLRTKNDLEKYSHSEGQFIANIKVSKVGGVLRGLQLVNSLKEKGWPIIIGAHVAETSVMTRAGMCLAQAAGNFLTAQEGCFGTRLLEHEPAVPSLTFGEKGHLDLSKTYIVKTEDQHREYSADTWKNGWGLSENRQIIRMYE